MTLPFTTAGIGAADRNIRNIPGAIVLLLAAGAKL